MMTENDCKSIDKSADAKKACDAQGGSQDAAQRADEHATAASDTAAVSGRTMNKGNILKFVGLIAFFAIMAAIVVALWPNLAGLFEEGGVEALVQRVQDAGPMGVLMLLGLQLLQVIVAFIPGEVVQLAAGLMYGPWLGALIIFVGCVISTTIIFALVHTLGAPFVQDMVSTKWLAKMREFEGKGRLDIVVFILFLIPGMPKDVLTYIVPLTSMPLKRFVVLANVARIPGILGSTFFAAGVTEGNWIGAIIIAVAFGIAALLAIIFRDRIMEKLHSRQD